MHDAEQNQAVGKRDVDEEPEPQETLRRVLKIEVVFRLDPVAHLRGDDLFGVIQIAVERGGFGEQGMPFALAPTQGGKRARPVRKKLAQIFDVEIA